MAGIPRRRLGGCLILRGPIWKVLPLTNEIFRPAMKRIVILYDITVAYQLGRVALSLERSMPQGHLR